MIFLQLSHENTSYMEIEQRRSHQGLVGALVFCETISMIAGMLSWDGKKPLEEKYLNKLQKMIGALLDGAAGYDSFLQMDD